MKLKLDELKKAIAWIEANTNSDFIKLEVGGSKANLRCFDKKDREVSIEIFDGESPMLPKITKTEIL
jgi:hypothetical protein